MDHIFLIGPGGVGKTTVGQTLARLLDRPFIDLDDEFCNRIGPIRTFLDTSGYAAYLRYNARLFEDLLEKIESASVFALSSGFMVNDAEPELALSNRTRVEASGISVLLMPSWQFAESLEIVVARQLNRGLSLERTSQIATFSARFQPYMELGALKIFSTLPADDIAAEIARELA